MNIDLRGQGRHSINRRPPVRMLKLPVTVTNDSQEVALDNYVVARLPQLALCVAANPAPLFHVMGSGRCTACNFLAVPFHQAGRRHLWPTAP